MAIELPSNPTVGQTYTAENGAVYAWDGTKWSIDYDDEGGQSYWVRNDGTETLSPLYPEDTISVENYNFTTLTELP